MITAKSIRDYRKKKGLTQQEFARLMGRARTTIINWERDANTINLRDVVRLSQILGIDVEELGTSTGEDDPMLAEMVELYSQWSLEQRLYMLQQMRFFTVVTAKADKESQSKQEE